MLQTESLKITPEILGLIAELDEFKGVWLAVFPHPVKPCPSKLSGNQLHQSFPKSPEASREMMQRSLGQHAEPYRAPRRIFRCPPSCTLAPPTKPGCFLAFLNHAAALPSASASC